MANLRHNNNSSETIDTSEKIEKLRRSIADADAVIIGAGAGLSTSAGFIYSGERFEKYFGDFIDKYHFHDMYEGGFYPFESLEEHWTYWSRYIYINRYMDAPIPVYENLFELVRDKDYFVLTTNVDHCFQKAGFAKERLFYTQGDFGLFQCSEPCHDKTYDNEAVVRDMLLSQGFLIAEDGELIVPEGKTLAMEIAPELVPHCPVCGMPMTMNLRADATFVQDDGWDIHAGYYEQFMSRHKKSSILFLELGVGYNTPGIIKYPFWQATANNKNAVYACVNFGEAYCPDEIKERAVCINADIADTINSLKI